jgi:hypothetical protein
VSEKKPRGYLDQSRNLTNALILIAPLLVLYEVGLLLTNFQALNGVDFATIIVFHFGGAEGLLVFNLLVLIGIGIAAHLRGKERSLSADIVPFMLVESTIYAFSLGIVISKIMGHLPLGGKEGMNPLTAMVASLGAGVNEELFFRLGLVAFPTWAICGSGPEAKNKPLVQAIAVLVSSLLFSGAHYIGPRGDPFEIHSFVFRFLAGAIFALIFLVRGLAVSVYTHAIYDIYVLVVLAR